VKFTDNGSLETSQVTFQYRTSDTDLLKTCTTSVDHFIHRFLQHVLPSGFVKVRYFGFLAPTRRSLLSSFQARLQHYSSPLETTSLLNTNANILQPALPKQQPTCPKCGQPMSFLRSINPTLCRSP
jgi:hypothetical protein